MARTVFVRTITLVLLIGLLAALPVMGGCKKKDVTPEVPIAGGGAVSGSEGGGDTDVVNGADPANELDDPAATTTKPTTLTIRLYWVEAGENALGVERAIPYTQGVAKAAINELLAGPTAQEQTTWPAIDSAIPEGTRLLGVTISGGVAKVDFSREFESGGGTFGVTARLAQVVYTLDQFDSVDAVEFYIEGKRVEMFSSEGLILEGPQRGTDYYDLLPIDA